MAGHWMGHNTMQYYEVPIPDYDRLINILHGLEDGSISKDDLSHDDKVALVDLLEYLVPSAVSPNSGL